jgi:tetratricopeptide (TPR) repeat protein
MISTMASASTPSPDTRRPPSPEETSDRDSDVNNPTVLLPVIEDLCRFTDELGPNHVKVADTWNSLGLIRLHMQHNESAAIKCHQEAIKIYKMNDLSTLQLAVTLGDLGACYERVGEPEHALGIYQEALQMLEVSEVSSSHLVAQSIMRSIARLKRE